MADDKIDEESPSPEEAEEEGDEIGEEAEDEDKEDEGLPRELATSAIVLVADQDRDDQPPQVITPPVIVAAEAREDTSATLTVDVSDAGDHDPGQDQEKDEGGGNGQVTPPPAWL